MNLLTKKSYKKRVLVLSVLVALFVVVIIYNNKSFFYDMLVEYKLIPLKETFTELYFDDHLNLPRQVIKDKNIEFSFVINNKEDRDMDYKYAVYLISGDYSRIIDLNSVRIPSGDLKRIKISYLPVESSINGLVYVELVGMNKSLHFLLTANK